MIYISLILVLIAAFLNSIMDTLFTHFSVSIFKDKNVNFWNPNISWNTCKTILGYHIDAWHICKSLMIICLDLAIVINLNNTILYKFAIFCIIGIIWNFVFNIFYSWILKKK